MGSRFWPILLVVAPLVVYSAVWSVDYGTPADFLHLPGAAQAQPIVDNAGVGLLNVALLDLSFGFVGSVGDLRYLRGVALGLLVFCGLALWQVLERGGWSDFEATMVALAAIFLPTAQLAAGWATAWPGLLATVISLAGFAAIENELEQGGPGRFVAMAGGVLLYLTAAMCYLPSALMALVPLVALGVSRPERARAGTGRWFSLHVVLLVVGIGVAWVLQRRVMDRAGVVEQVALVERALDLGRAIVPLAAAPFVVRDDVPVAWLGWGPLVLSLALLVWVGRCGSGEERRGWAAWQFVVPVAVAIYLLAAWVTPGWGTSLRAVWPLAGIGLVVLFAAVREALAATGVRRFWGRGIFAGVALLAGAIAFGQVGGLEHFK